jgi:hypothetical protein
MHTVDFLGIGAQKCGTTWLFRQMSRHPQVAFPCGKEFHYWDHASDPDVEAWVSALQPATRQTPDGRPIVTGEITPAYAMLHPGPIRAIRDRCPDVRLFIALRNPVERAWSHALMGLARKGQDPRDASDQWLIDHFRSEQSRQRGDYAACLEQWWAAFPREQLLLIFAEDIANAPATVMDRLATHLGIDPADFAAMPDGAWQETVRPMLEPGLPATDAPPIRPSLVMPLIEMYAEPIDRLQRMLDRDISHWRQPPEQRTLPGPSVPVNLWRAPPPLSSPASSP